MKKEYSFGWINKLSTDHFTLSSHEELDQVIVYSTRTNNRIEDAPLKVEVLSLEEV